MARPPRRPIPGAPPGVLRPGAPILAPMAMKPPQPPQGGGEMDVGRMIQMARAAVNARQLHTAIEIWERAVCLAPANPEALLGLAHAHIAVGNTEDVLRIVAMMRARMPGSLVPDYEESRVLADLGRFDEARVLLDKITTENPRHAPAWFFIAKQKRVQPGDPMFGKIEAAIAQAAEPSNDMMLLCSALAKAYDDIGEYDRAFDYQLRAKRQITARYSLDEDQKRFQGARDVFTRAFFEKRREYGDDSRKPIFVVGMPRSGTTLTEQILASHPDVYGAGELDYMGLAAGEITSMTPDNAPVHRAALKLGPEASVIVARRYLRRVEALDRVHPRFVDKMPHNFVRIGLISLLLPNASIVHCRREPIDTCLSMFMQSFAIEHGYANSLDLLGQYYRMYVGLMEHWAEHAPIDILDFSYADLLADQRGQTERLARHVGLSWDERMIAFHETDRRVATPSRAQVRSPLHSGSKARWRNYAHRLGPLIDALGPLAPSDI